MYSQSYELDARCGNKHLKLTHLTATATIQLNHCMVNCYNDYYGGKKIG